MIRGSHHESDGDAGGSAVKPRVVVLLASGALAALGIGWWIRGSLGPRRVRSLEPPETESEWFTGRIVDQSGRPVAGATARSWVDTEDPDAERPVLASATTNENGEYWLRVGKRGLEAAARVGTVRFECVGFIEASIDASLRPKTSPATDLGDAALAREARILGIIEWESVEHGELTHLVAARVSDGIEVARGGIDDHGEFRIVGLPAGRYRIGVRGAYGVAKDCSVSMGDQALEDNACRLAEGQDALVSVRVADESKGARRSRRTEIEPYIRVTVAAHDGKPIPGAQLVCYAASIGGWFRVHPGSAGDLKMGSIPGSDLTILAIVGNRVVARKSFSGRLPETVVIRADPAPICPTIQICVREKHTGEPIRAATIEALRRSFHARIVRIGDEPGDDPVPKAQQSYAGTYELPSMPWAAGGSFIEVGAPGFARVVRSIGDLDKNGEITSFDVELSPPGALFGRLMNANTEESLEGVEMELVSDTTSRDVTISQWLGLTCKSGKNGEFRIEGIAEGKYALHLVDDGLVHDATLVGIEIESGKTRRFDARAKVHSRLVVQVVNAAGEPVRWADVVAKRDDAEVVARPLELGTGCFVAVDLEPGTWLVRASSMIDNERVTASVKAEARAGMNERVTIRLSK